MSLLSTLSSSNPIKTQLAYGEEYRTFRSKLKKTISPVGSPLDVTFFLRKSRRVEKVVEDIKSPSTAPHTKHVRRGGCKSKSVPHIKNSFWERAKLTHKQYMDVLSTPHLQSCGDTEKPKRFKSKTTSSICSPRIIQMSCPTKRRVLATWQDYGDHLPAEALHRFHDMLHTSQNIDLKDARRHFKLRDRKKRKQALKRRLRKKKKKNLKQVYWLRRQIEETSNAILSFFSGEPTLDMNFKQLLISDTLLVVLAGVLGRKDPILRYNRKLGNRQLVKMVDKIAVWIDSVSKIMEMQTFDEDSEAQMAGGSSVSSISGASGDIGGMGEVGDLEGSEMEGGEMEGIDYVSSLERLIRILAHASPSYLGGPVDDMENLTRNELLNKIKVLNKDYSDATTPAELLKKILMDWAMHNQPSQVDIQVIKKIEKVAELLAAMLAAEDVYGMLPGLPKEDSTMRSFREQFAEFGEDGAPLPGTITEVIGPDGSVALGVVDEDGYVLPVRMTPSGNLIPTVYDKYGKVVDKLFDGKENLLDVTFNRFGVPEPDTYNGPLFDDVKYEHELLFNEKGRIIPLCYDKDGNPIYAAYDANGNPIIFGPDGQPVDVPPGANFKIVDGKLVIIGPDGEITEIAPKPREKIEDVEREMLGGKGIGEDGFGEEGEEGSIGEEGEIKSGEEGERGSRESMITVIKGHKPKKVYEHSKDTVCCLSLKIWAVWLLEIIHNAHNWTKWVSNVIGQIREFAAILRGEVLLPNGQKKVIFKDDWNKFVDGINEDVIAWRQYCRHVNDLTTKIVEKFHGKKVNCCEKCLQDHLIKNVVTAHDTMRALTEALNCAGYWQRCLDEIVQATTKLTEIRPATPESSTDEETGWSYSSSSDEDTKNYSCYAKRRKLTPSSTWKKLKDTPCSCPCKLKQLFPKSGDSTAACSCTESAPVTLEQSHKPRYCF